LQLELLSRTEGVGLEPPGDFELVEIRGVDLVERRIAGAMQIAAVGLPLTVWRAVRLALPGGRHRRPQEQKREWAQTQSPAQRRSHHSYPPQPDRKDGASLYMRCAGGAGGTGTRSR